MMMTRTKTTTTTTMMIIIGDAIRATSGRCPVSLLVNENTCHRIIQTIYSLAFQGEQVRNNNYLDFFKITHGELCISVVA